MHSKDWIPEFKSIYGSYIKDLIMVKRNCGFKYGYTICLRFLELDTFLFSLNQDKIEINQIIVDKWLDNNKIKKSTKVKLYSIMCALCKYLRAEGIENVIQPENHNLRYKSEFIPYIFSDDEINRIFKVLKENILEDNSNKNKAFYVLFSLYYGCGLRLMEALNLKVKDYDRKNSTIIILNSKNDVTRNIPLSESIAYHLNKYMDDNHYEDTNNYIFINDQNKIISVNTVYNMYHKALIAAKIKVRYDGKRQRIHDLRHTFACKALKQMESKKFDLYTSLPILCVYLGHKSIVETEYYLRLVQDEASNQLEKTNKYVESIYESKGEFYEGE